MCRVATCCTAPRIMVTDPHVVGYQAAGRVRELGTGVEGFAVGAPVVATMAHGTHAELARCPPRSVSRSPTACRSRTRRACRSSSAPPTTACSSSVTPGRRDRPRPGGGGGVGLAAIQLAKAAGATVSPPSSDGRLERLREYGMDHGIDYTTRGRRGRGARADRRPRRRPRRRSRSAAAPSRRASPRWPTAAASAGSAAPGASRRRPRSGR